MHKYTILCIKMNNYTENLSPIGQIGDKNGTKFLKMWQTGAKICHNTYKIWQK